MRYIVFVYMYICISYKDTSIHIYNMESNLSRQFIEGLRRAGFDYETVRNDFKYAGGNMQQNHRNYYKLVYKTDRYPPHKDNCICGHKINENCYITNSETILTVGNCCIKKFIPKSGRTCEICSKPHKNRIVNRCNTCRFGICDRCNKKCGDYYTTCYTCK
jgi:hypothetical protein